ncbi:hypothetical protein CEXT_160641 [Caerostris extrusa]|uniref:Uncharacterized protein n=1 Tax=Caerostris extrusa TaxID=172846 RepID=A0AAV4YG81_CAEEX|nr:hypothetical protein CEXT_160641 [Caerostris extrusa]
MISSANCSSTSSRFDNTVREVLEQVDKSDFTKYGDLVQATNDQLKPSLNWTRTLTPDCVNVRHPHTGGRISVQDTESVCTIVRILIDDYLAQKTRL